jgi:predicted transglutaminase-like cysteine proteinase
MQLNNPERRLALLSSLFPPLLAAEPWQLELQQLRGYNERQQVEAINQQVNRRVRFVSDQIVWHRADYWATPGEALAQGQGDCEDYAIAKYFLLRSLGVAAEKLWLVYAKVRIGAPDSRLVLEHMVLSYTATPQSEPLILDNMLNSLLPEAQRSDLTPVFRFNTQVVQINGIQYPASELQRWHALLKRRQLRQQKNPSLEP